MQCRTLLVFSCLFLTAFPATADPGHQPNHRAKKREQRSSQAERIRLC